MTTLEPDTIYRLVPIEALKEDVARIQEATDLDEAHALATTLLQQLNVM